MNFSYDGQGKNLPACQIVPKSVAAERIHRRHGH
jgi:hypothetical protein